MNPLGKRKGHKTMWIIILIIVVIIAVSALGGILIDGPGRREVAAITFADTNLNNLSDGNYTGEFKGTKSHLRDAEVVYCLLFNKYLIVEAEPV